jgi:hypothetical protein
MLTALNLAQEEQLMANVNITMSIGFHKTGNVTALGELSSMEFAKKRT